MPGFWIKALIIIRKTDISIGIDQVSSTRCDYMSHSKRQNWDKFYQVIVRITYSAWETAVSYEPRIFGIIIALYQGLNRDLPSVYGYHQAG